MGDGYIPTDYIYFCLMVALCTAPLYTPVSGASGHGSAENSLVYPGTLWVWR